MLESLYEELILDHNRNPRNFQKEVGHTHDAVGYNPLCGDDVRIYMLIEDGIVKDAGFDGVGCAISTASASMLIESVIGKTVDEVTELFGEVHSMLTKGSKPDLGKLNSLAGASKYPGRVKCATLAWHTLQAALNNTSDPVTTE